MFLKWLILEGCISGGEEPLAFEMLPTTRTCVLKGQYQNGERASLSQPVLFTSGVQTLCVYVCGYTESSPFTHHPVDGS